MGKKETKEVARIFDFFDDGKSETTNIHSLRKIVKELNEIISVEKFKKILERAV